MALSFGSRLLISRHLHTFTKLNYNRVASTGPRGKCSVVTLSCSTRPLVPLNVANFKYNHNSHTFFSYNHKHLELLTSATLVVCKSRGDSQDEKDWHGTRKKETQPTSDEGVEIPVTLGKTTRRGKFAWNGHLSDKLPPWFGDDDEKDSNDRGNGWPRRVAARDGGDDDDEKDAREKLLKNMPWVDAAKSQAPFWTVFNNMTPNSFGNACILACGAIYGLWFLSSNLPHPRLAQFLTRHFVTSRDAIQAGRWHTLLTSGEFKIATFIHILPLAFSHSTLVHLAFNCIMLQQLMTTFQNHMGLTLEGFIDSFAKDNFFLDIYRNIVNSPRYTPPGHGARARTRSSQVTTRDIFNVALISALASSLGHVWLYRTPVLGASGAVSGLVYLLAATFPSCTFKMVFPIPGMTLTILQLIQVFMATNVAFLFFARASNVAWAAHLFGMAAGALYCSYQKYWLQRRHFYDPITLCCKTFKQQWKRSFGNF